MGYKKYAPHDKTELILVDDGSTDGLRETVPLAKEVFRRVRVVTIDNSKCPIPVNLSCRNPALGINVGVCRASGKLIILTPPEGYPLADNIHKMQEIMNLGESRAYCFGRTIFGSEELGKVLSVDGWFPATEREIGGRLPSETLGYAISSARQLPYPYFAGLRKSDYEAINGIDLEFLRGDCCEDDDFSLRMKRVGSRWVWTDECTVLHQWHPSLRDTAKKSDYDLNFRHMESNKERMVVRVNGNINYGCDMVVVKDEVYE